MSPDQDRDLVQEQCTKFLESIGAPGFVILGWKQEDGSMEVVQSLKDMTPLEYLHGTSWAMHNASHEMDPYEDSDEPTEEEVEM